MKRATTILLLICVAAFAQQKGSFTDERDGKTYKTVTIRQQTWMAENLNYKTGNSWCYDNNESNCQKYGRLYDWNTAMKACPKGWHLPDYFECGSLPYHSSDHNSMIWKARGGWNENGNGTDDYGFSALPGGSRDTNGNFKGVGSKDFYWSAVEHGSKYALFWSSNELCPATDAGFVAIYKTTGLSVRCIKHFIGERKEYYENGKLFLIENYNDNNKHGERKVFHENGQIIILQNYKDGKLHGECKTFYENGQIIILQNYKDGKLHGEFKTFYENGKLQSVQNYKDGKLIGEPKGFYENGKLQSVTNYKDGALSEIKEFYENGKLKSVTSYKYGNTTSIEVKEFDIDGKLIREDKFEEE